MGMFLKHLTLRSFRNYSSAHIPFKKGINVIHGKNGAGKTTLLEAIFLLSTGRSFRTNHLSDLIKKGDSYFFIEAHFNQGNVEQTLSIGYDGQTKRIHHNSTYFQNLSNILGILPSVLYAPKDIDLISGAPSERRRFLNIQLAQTDPLYVHHLNRYHQAKKQRNVLLKKKSEEGMDSFEQMMATSTHYLMKKRDNLIDALKPQVKKFVKNLSSDEDPFDLFYEPSISINSTVDEIKQLYIKQRPKDIFLGTTLVGPHRDNFLITYDQKDAKIYASEGQKRTFITALKMAEWENLKSSSECFPLMHIDDFAIHLDQRRTHILQDTLGYFKQVFLTTPMINPHPLTNSLYLEKGALCKT